jgi:hypothetical protein
MIFTHTWNNETVLHEAYVTNEKFFNVAIREVTEGGDPVEDFVDYDPSQGASDDQLTKICDDIYDYLLLAALGK